MNSKNNCNSEALRSEGPTVNITAPHPSHIRLVVVMVRCRLGFAAERRSVRPPSLVWRLWLPHLAILCCNHDPGADSARLLFKSWLLNAAQAMQQLSPCLFDFLTNVEIMPVMYPSPDGGGLASREKEIFSLSPSAVSDNRTTVL